jgi:hypothetical protein
MMVLSTVLYAIFSEKTVCLKMAHKIQKKLFHFSDTDYRSHCKTGTKDVLFHFLFLRTLPLRLAQLKARQKALWTPL